MVSESEHAYILRLLIFVPLQYQLGGLGARVLMFIVLILVRQVHPGVECEPKEIQMCL